LGSVGQKLHFHHHLFTRDTHETEVKAGVNGYDWITAALAQLEQIICICTCHPPRIWTSATEFSCELGGVWARDYYEIRGRSKNTLSSHLPSAL